MDEWVVTGGVFNVGHIVNVVLQTIYIGKFFWWETGYFNTLDITLDRAGYYICWGCLVWVPAFYTYSSYFLVAQPSLLSTQAAIGVAFLGKSLGFTFCARSDVLYFCKNLLQTTLFSGYTYLSIANYRMHFSNSAWYVK